MPNTKLKTTILACSVAFVSHTVAAQGNQPKSSPFIGLTQTSLKIKFDELPNNSWKTDAIGVNAGFPLTTNLWLEAKALKGTSGSSQGNVRIELDHYLGINLVGRAPIATTGFSFYGSIGAGQTKLTASAPGLRVKESDSSLSYGFGAMYNTGPFNFRIGYENLYSDDGVEIDGVNIGGSYRF